MRFPRASSAAAAMAPEAFPAPTTSTRPRGAEAHAGQGAVHEGVDVGGGQRGVEDGARRLAEAQCVSFCSRCPASIKRSSVLGKQKRILVRPSSRWA